ncbi:hypothetical protein D3C85_714650 [compost metagenome]
MAITYTVIGEHGRVKYTGSSNTLPPETEGLVIEQLAPPGTWWDGSAFVAIGEAPSMTHRFDWPTHTWVEQKTLAVAKATRRALIDQEFCARAAHLTEGYPEPERLTWPVQQAEALAYQANPQAPTPYLDGLAAARGITAADMRQRTLAVVQAFMQASQQIVGTRQALQTSIDDAQTVAAVDAVAWP